MFHHLLFLIREKHVKVVKIVLVFTKQEENELSNKNQMDKDTLKIIIKEVWSNVLEVVDVGDDDNFFDIGGHSLLIVQVLCEIEERLGIELNQAEFMLAISTVNDCVEFVYSRL